MSKMDIMMERLEVQELYEALASVHMDVVSARGTLARIEEVVEETKHRLDSLLTRLREFEKEREE